jgi:hypothetical protein
MTRLRFESVRDVFAAFPIAEYDLNQEPTDDPSLDFLTALTSSEEFDKAVGFCAFLLPRREAVWWGCRSVRKFVPKRTADEEAGIRLAEEWLKEPDEERRKAALELGLRSSSKLATTHLALAAGWAGRTFTIGAGDPIPIQPHQTARAIRSAILIAAVRAGPAERPDLMRSCLEDAARIASDETVDL